MNTFDSYATQYDVLDSENKIYSVNSIAYYPDFYEYRNYYKQHIILPDETYRPDKIAFRLWGNQYLSWVLDVINNFSHGIQEYTIGRSITYIDTTILNSIGIV